MLATLLLAAAQITVGPAGSGADFEQIAPAVAAAQPGDTVLVAPGEYLTFELRAGVSVVGAGSELVTVRTFGSQPSLLVADVPAGETALVAGLRVRTADGSPGLQAFVAVQQCAGAVVLADLAAGPQHPVGTGSIAAAPTSLVLDSAAVYVDGCDFEGFEPQVWQPSQAGQAALRVERSGLTLTDTRLRGADGGSQAMAAGPGGAGLIAIESTLSLARCRVRGGDGGVRTEVFPFAYDGAPGVFGSQSTARIAGGPGNELRGGAGLEVAAPAEGGEGGPAVLLGAGSEVRVGSDVDAQNGPDADGTVQPHPYAAPPNSLVVETYPLPTANVRPVLAAPGASVTLSVSGSPGGVQVAFRSPAPAAPWTLAGIDGLLVLPPSATLLTVLPVGPAGVGGLAATVPADPALAGGALVVQSVEVLPGSLRASNPAALVIAP